MADDCLKGSTVASDPTSIDFKSLDAHQFEELCFDLLRRVGYLDLVWRQGGADQGRDIQGTFDAVNPLLGTVRETWFVQCKHYASGVSPTPLNEAIAWADAGRPQHLLYIVSTYPTNSARIWLEVTGKQKAYGINVLEGRDLAERIVQYPDLVQRYFFTEPRRLLREAMKAWANYGIVPTLRHIWVCSARLKLPELDLDELGFLWVGSRLVAVEAEYWLPVFDKPLRFDSLADALAERANSEAELTPDWASVRVFTSGVGTDDSGLVTLSLQFTTPDPLRYGAYLATMLRDHRVLEVLYVPGSPTRVRVLSPEHAAEFEALKRRAFLDRPVKDGDHIFLNPGKATSRHSGATSKT